MKKPQIALVTLTGSWRLFYTCISVNPLSWRWGETPLSESNKPVLEWNTLHTFSSRALHSFHPWRCVERYQRASLSRWHKPNLAVQIIIPSSVRIARATLVLEVLEDLGEEMRVGVDLQHFGTHFVNDPQRALPEHLLVGLHQEGLQRVRDLVAHVRISQVQAGEKGGLQLVLAGNILGHRLPAEQVDEHQVGGSDETLVLPALDEQRPVDVSEPEDDLIWAQLFEFVASPAHELAQAAKELSCGGLHDDSSRRDDGAAARLPRDRQVLLSVLGYILGLTRSKAFIGYCRDWHCEWPRLRLALGAWLRLLKIFGVQLVNGVSDLINGWVGVHFLGTLLLGRGSD